MQSDTLKRLNGVVSDYIAQRLSMHEGCCSLASILDNNAMLTNEQCIEMYNHYGECLEQAAAAQA